MFLVVSYNCASIVYLRNNVVFSSRSESTKHWELESIITCGNLPKRFTLVILGVLWISQKIFHKILCFVNFTKDFSRKVWVYFLKKKYEVFTKFKLWKIEVKNQTDRKIKCLWLDNETK